MKIKWIMGILASLCGPLLATTPSQDVRLYLRSYIQIIAGCDGYRKQTGYPVPWVFDDHQRIYFIVSYFNILKERSLDTGDLGKMVRLSQISRLEFKGQCPEEVETIRQAVQIPASLKLVGAMKEKPEHRALSRFTVDPRLPIPERLAPYKGAELLFSVDLAAPLPPGDYQLELKTLRIYDDPDAYYPVYFRWGEIRRDYDRLHARMCQAWIYSVFGKDKQEKKAMESLVRVAPGVPISWMIAARYFDFSRNDLQKALKYALEGLKRFPCTPEEQNWVPTNDSFQIQCGIGNGIYLDVGDTLENRPCFERYVENLREKIAAQAKGKGSKSKQKR